MTLADRFWEHKSLEQMNLNEWEAVCDGCAKCCLHKIEDQEAIEQGDTQEALHFTNVVCRELNTKTCACNHYATRTERVPECVSLSKHNIAQVYFLPPSCSYRRLHEGRGLPSWHPLLNKGKKAKMHSLGMSVRGKIIAEQDVNLERLDDCIVSWPINDLD